MEQSRFEERPRVVTESIERDAGDAPLFDKGDMIIFYREYLNAIYDLCYYCLGGDQRAATMLTYDIFTRYWLAYGNHAQRATPRLALLAIALACLDRRSSATTPIVMNPKDPPHALWQGALLSVLQRLPMPERTMLGLVIFCGATVAEVALLLSMNEAEGEQIFARTTQHAKDEMRRACLAALIETLKQGAIKKHDRSRSSQAHSVITALESWFDQQ